MIEEDFIERIITRMNQFGVTQGELASTCGLSQGHLSKVLSGKLKLAAKTKAELHSWLSPEQKDADTREEEDAQEIAKILAKGPRNRRMQIMQLIRIVDRLVS